MYLQHEVLWDLDLNSISMINLVMAVGLVVDYSTSELENVIHEMLTVSHCGSIDVWVMDLRGSLDVFFGLPGLQNEVF